MKKFHSGPKTMWKNGLLWFSRPLNMVLAIWANVGPFRANISQEVPVDFYFILSMALFYQNKLKTGLSLFGIVFLIFELGHFPPQTNSKKHKRYVFIEIGETQKR